MTKVSPLVLEEAAEKPENLAVRVDEAPASPSATTPPPIVVASPPDPVAGDESTKLRRAGTEATAA